MKSKLSLRNLEALQKRWNVRICLYCDWTSGPRKQRLLALANRPEKTTPSPELEKMVSVGVDQQKYLAYSSKSCNTHRYISYINIVNKGTLSTISGLISSLFAAALHWQRGLFSGKEIVSKRKEETIYGNGAAHAS